MCFEPRGKPKRTWKEVVERDTKSLKLSKEDALVRSNWRQLIRGTAEDSDDSEVGGGYCVRLFMVLAHPGYQH